MTIAPVDAALPPAAPEQAPHAAAFEHARQKAASNRARTEPDDTSKSDDEPADVQVDDMIVQLGGQVMMMLLMPRMTELLGEALADDE